MILRVRHIENSITQINMKATLKMILCGMMLLGFFFPVMAKDGSSSSSSTITPSLIFTFDDACLEPKTKIGQALKNAGFTQMSVKEKKRGHCEEEQHAYRTYTPSFVKTFTKNGTTVKYEYAICDAWSNTGLHFAYVQITFPSLTERDSFVNSLKKEIKKIGYRVEFVDWDDLPRYYIVDSEYNGWEIWPYCHYEIKGKTFTYYELWHFDPHCWFE